MMRVPFARRPRRLPPHAGTLLGMSPDFGDAPAPGLAGLVNEPAESSLAAEQQRLNRAEFWAREELIALLSVAGTLAGLSVTVVAFMDKPRNHAAAVAVGTVARHHAHLAPATTVVDDLFSLCALLFLVCVYLIFIALRTRQAPAFRWLVRLVDLAFAAGLTMMTAAGFVLVYTVW